MANASTEIAIFSNGKVHYAPAGTDLPVGLGDLDPAFVEVGYIGEDGVEMSPSLTEEVTRAWQSFYPVRRTVTERDFTLSFDLHQWNPDNVVLAFGGGEVTSPATGVYRFDPPPPEEQPEYAIVVDGFDGDKHYRFVLRKAKNTELGDVTFQRGESAAMPVTVGVVGDTTDEDQPWYFLTDDESMAGS